jgi:tRNA(Ile)-lysidine synthase
MHLAAGWLKDRSHPLSRGSVLTVDHGLRPGSADEAKAAAEMAARAGFGAHVLTWRGPRPRANVEDSARQARYRLLGDWCRAHGVRTIVLAHTRDDQAETVLLRLAAGSGPHGLAGMAPVQDGADFRLVRPLLDVARARLRTTLQARKQDWIEDPSNRDERFARIGVRRSLAEDGGENRAMQLAAAAGELGRFRAGQERAIADVLARAACVHPEGYASLDLNALAAAPSEIGWRALGALLATIGGLAHAPRGEPLRRLHAELCAGGLGKGRTLARCRLIPESGGCLVVRESRGIETVRLGAGVEKVTVWDGRFAVSRAGTAEIGPLGATGWAALVTGAPALRATAFPYAARLALPALRDRRGLVAVPALGYRRPGGPKKTLIAAFQPLRPLAAAAFAAPTLP